jgi:RNA polymerase sigma factor (sigma-70 family)
MADSRDQTELERRFVKRFDELRAKRKPDREIFAEAAEDLKQLARQMSRRAPAGPSFTATRLFQDTFLELFPHSAPEFKWEQGHDLFIAAARAMRDLKVEYIRRKMTDKRGSGQVDSLDELREEKGYEASDRRFEAQAMRAFAVDEAMRRLRAEFPDREKVILLRYWGDDDNPDGLTESEIAGILKRTPDQVKYAIRAGKARLKYYLSIRET